MTSVVDDDERNAMSQERRDLLTEWLRIQPIACAIDWESVDKNDRAVRDALSFVDEVEWFERNSEFGIPLEYGEDYFGYEHDVVEDAEVRTHMRVLAEYLQKRARHVTKGARS